MRILFSDPALSQQTADLLVIGVPAGKVAEAVAGLGAFGASVSGLATADEFSGKAGTTLLAPTYGAVAATRVLLVGTGAAGATEVRNAAGVAGTQARARGARSVAMAFPLTELGAAGITAVAEAFAEGNYRFDRYKAEGSRKAGAESLALVGVSDASALARAEAMIAGQTLARDLVNEPAAVIYPETLAKVAEGLASDCVTVTVLDFDAIKARGMGGIVGVGQGSTRTPRFVHMTYTPAGAQQGHVALVGKGVTFDSGGLSLKPSDAMQTMRCDMAGAAAVIGAMKTISMLKPSCRVDVVFGAVENMPSGDSYKLGDILTMYNGKRVEIHNTDAEGRLVLADCLSYVSREVKPDAVIDLATLTGAAVIALGDWYSATYTRDDAFAATIATCAADAGEAVWRMPLPDLYKDKLKAEWADLKNVGGRAGGSITAALFLAEFVGSEQWMHIDIAGPAFMDSTLMHYAPGGSGTMVRTLARWVEGYAK
jgi:leucyl aminopeptidase